MDQEMEAPIDDLETLVAVEDEELLGDAIGTGASSINPNA